MDTTQAQQAVNSAQLVVNGDNATLQADTAILTSAQAELNTLNLINQLEKLTFDQAVAINQLMGNDPDNTNGVSISYPVPA